jgi:hypothetical protein
MKKLLIIPLMGALSIISTAATAAGTSTIETGFASVATDLTTLLGGAGGVLLTIIALLFGVVMLVVGRGWLPLVAALGVAFVIGQGLPILSGISGATAPISMLFG